MDKRLLNLNNFSADMLPVPENGRQILSKAELLQKENNVDFKKQEIVEKRKEISNHHPTSLYYSRGYEGL